MFWMSSAPWKMSGRLQADREWRHTDPAASGQEVSSKHDRGPESSLGYRTRHHRSVSRCIKVWQFQTGASRWEGLECGLSEGVVLVHFLSCSVGIACLLA